MAIRPKRVKRMQSSLESIVRSARELKSVTERLLAFNKQMESGQQNANVLEIFRSLFGLLERAYTKAGIQVDKAHTHHVEHHRAHLASAFFCSPFEEAAVVSIDGFGDFSSVMWGIGRGNKIEVKGRKTRG